VEKDYAFSVAQGCDVRMYLFETFGGFGVEVVRLLKRLAYCVKNTMNAQEYEHEASWSTRNWMALQTQRLSVALHMGAASELALELRGLVGDAEAS
jgi:hypothetical protein